MAKTLTEIVNGSGSKKQAKKIAELVNTVATARAAYGNENTVIAAPVVNTCEGSVKMTSLSAADKLALVNRQIVGIRQEVAEVENFLEGKVSRKVLGKVLDEVQAASIATNAVLVNLGKSTKSKYL